MDNLAFRDLEHKQSKSTTTMAMGEYPTKLVTTESSDLTRRSAGNREDDERGGCWPHTSIASSSAPVALVPEGFFLETGMLEVGALLIYARRRLLLLTCS